VQEENNGNDGPKPATLLRHKESHHQSNEKDVGDGKPGIIKPSSTEECSVVTQKNIPAKPKTKEA
jgi:hypothetical protein